MRTKDFSLDHAMTALCIYEQLLHLSGQNVLPEWALAVQEAEGIYGLRRTALDMAPGMDAAYEHAVKAHGYDNCFDWEFVPAVLDLIERGSELYTSPEAVAERALSAVQS